MKKSTISKQRSYLTDLFSTLAVKSHRRSTLWLMLFTLLLLPTSMVAQTDYDTSVTFTALAGKPEGFDNEKYTNLFDGLKDPGNSTKWCAKFVSNGGTYVIFEASKAGIPVGYTITTGNDNSAYKGRNPRSWKLYGNNEGKNGAWTLIQEVSYDTKLQDVNCASYDFTCEGSTPYKYFKWEITGIKNKDYIQVGEFELKLNTGYQVYAEFDEGTGTLTFKYGPSTSKPEGAYKLNVGPYLPGWHAQKEKIKTVVFDASFAIARPTTCHKWFFGCKNLTDIKGIEYLNTEKVTSMIYMFDGCTKLESLDLTNFNTAEVKSMTYMFNNCSTLTSLNLSNFNTAKVTDMNSMFYNCNELTSLDLTSFNTAEVTDMSNMFGSCFALTSLDLSSFNTAKVTNMSNMFRLCKALTSLDLSNFNTAKVTDMSYMFKNCYALTSLDLSSFNTAKVTNMKEMFNNCPALTTIYASDKFVTDKVTNSGSMFYGCTELKGFIDKYDENKIDGTYANYKTGYFTKLVAKNGDKRYGIAGETAHLTVDNLTLADNKDFVAYEPFAATVATYSRTMKTGTTWGTLCLPFEVSLENQNFRAFKLLSANETTNTIELEEITTSIAAGTPVIIKMTNGATELNFSVNNKDIAKDAQTTATADNNYQLQGLYAKKVFVKDTDDNCYIVKGNKLMNPSKLLENSKVKEVNCKAFRAYMVDNSSKPAGAKMFSIGFDETATAIDNLTTIADDKAEYYDLQGHRLNGPQRGVNIVKRGNKTMKVIIK